MIHTVRNQHRDIPRSAGRFTSGRVRYCRHLYGRSRKQTGTTQKDADRYHCTEWVSPTINDFSTFCCQISSETLYHSHYQQNRQDVCYYILSQHPSQCLSLYQSRIRWWLRAQWQWIRISVTIRVTHTTRTRILRHTKGSRATWPFSQPFAGSITRGGYPDTMFGS